MKMFGSTLHGLGWPVGNQSQFSIRSLERVLYRVEIHC